MKKWMFFTNFEKEEKWLNEMAKQGYQIIKKSFYSNMYEFKTIEPENSIIKIDYRKFNKIEEYKNYLTLFEDSGWEHLAGTKKSGYQYFKRLTSAVAMIFFPMLLLKLDDTNAYRTCQLHSFRFYYQYSLY